MNYDHAYHAGHLADVIKHLFLVALVQAFKEKSKGFLYLETHAGRGLYDLNSLAANKTKEAESGIFSVWPLLQKRDDPHVQTYCKILQSYNPSLGLRYYPGSILLAKALLRPQDRLCAAELEPKAFSELKKYLHSPKEIFFENGYHLLKRFLPSLEKRTLILIDPPFEDPKEWQTLDLALQEIYKRQANAVILVWYPLKAKLKIKHWLEAAKELPFKSLVNMTWEHPIQKPTSELQGAGLLLANAPWQFEAQAKALFSLFPLKTALDWLISPL